MTAQQLSITFFLQMFFILLACRGVGLLARKIGQPQVVGEMIAGVVLGPSLLGYFFPAWQETIFPKDSLKILYVGAQLGVGLYMFLVGVEFDSDLFRSRIRSAASISMAGMVVPFVLGGALAIPFLRTPGLFSEKAKLYEAMLFMGAAMSITAFPMLARIIFERGITGTPMGMLALAAGAIGDGAAWCILAIVVASFGAGPAVAVKAILGGLAYAVVVLTIGRRLLRKLGEAVEREGRVTPSILALSLMLFLLGAWTTDSVGIHAVFGGFLMGVAMPRGLLATELRRQLEPFAVIFLLPMFFTFSGLNTQLNVLTSPKMLVIAAAVMAAACIGKGVACWAAARIHGEDNRTAMAIGALMNARGLMELILLNIGLQKGIIGPGLFAIMVLMAILTTLMASPIFEWVYRRVPRGAEVLAPAGAE